MPVTAVRDEGALRMWVCRLPVHIDPAECTVLYGNLRRIRNCPMGRQSRRPLQQVSALPVGADDSVRPQNAVVFSEIYGEFATSSRADVGIGPLGSNEFAEDFRKIDIFCGRTESSAPTGSVEAFSEKMTKGICCKFQSAPKYVTFEFPQALRASVPTPIGPSGHFPLIGGIGPLCPRGAFGAYEFAEDFRKCSYIDKCIVDYKIVQRNFFTSPPSARAVRRRRRRVASRALRGLRPF